jgi:glycerate dehydrogenase
MKIVVLDGYTLNPGDLTWGPLEEIGDLDLYDRTDPRHVVARAKEADVIVTNKVPLTAKMVEALPHLRYVTVTATGYDMIDLEATGRRGIPVSNVPEYGTDSVAQFTMALLLELCHRVALHDKAVKDGEWASCPDWCFWKTPQILLKGRTMGIVGFGRIGRRVGELAHAFGMEVMAYDVHRGSEPSYRPFSWVSSLKDLFSKADVITLHCPQTPENVRFVDGELIGCMKREAFFINAARGGLVDEEALAQALNEGRIAGAAVDVVSEEPIKADNPLLGARNCLITPHMAWGSRSARKNLMDTTAANIRAFLSGRPINVVNERYLKGRGIPA